MGNWSSVVNKKVCAAHTVIEHLHFLWYIFDSMDCKHVYEKNAIMQHIGSKDAQGHCPVTGILSSLLDEIMKLLCYETSLCWIVIVCGLMWWSCFRLPQKITSRESCLRPLVSDGNRWSAVTEWATCESWCNRRFYSAVRRSICHTLLCKWFIVEIKIFSCTAPFWDANPTLLVLLLKIKKSCIQGERIDRD